MSNVKFTQSQWKKILEFLRTRSDLYVGQPLECKHFVTGVLWMARSGAQWRLLPKKYGDWNSVYKRFNRWSERGVWTALSWPERHLPGRAAFEHFASDPDMESIMIDATVVRAHSSAGVKGGSKTKKRWDAVKEASLPKSMHS